VWAAIQQLKEYGRASTKIRFFCFETIVDIVEIIEC